MSCTQIFLKAIFIQSQNWKKLLCVIAVDWFMGKQMLVYLINYYPLTKEDALLTDGTANMDESQSSNPE